MIKLALLTGSCEPSQQNIIFEVKEEELEESEEEGEKMTKRKNRSRNVIRKAKREREKRKCGEKIIDVCCDCVRTEIKERQIKNKVKL